MIIQFAGEPLFRDAETCEHDANMCPHRHEQCYLVELLVVGHSQLYVSGCYSAFLVVSCCVSCQLQDLSFVERKHSVSTHQTYSVCSGTVSSGTRILVRLQLYYSCVDTAKKHTIKMQIFFFCDLLLHFYFLNKHLTV